MDLDHSRNAELDLQLALRSMAEGRNGHISTIIRLPEHDYGSLAGSASIGSARDLLLHTAANMSSSRLVVDLAGVQFLGAEFVGVLARTAALLRQRSRGVVLRLQTDCLGALRKCGLDLLPNVSLLDCGLH